MCSSDLAVNRFIKTINNKKDNKADLNKLYNLSKYREMTVSGPSQEVLDKIKKELIEKGYVYNE